MTPLRLVIIPPTAAEPAPFMSLDASGRVLERGLLRLDAPVADWRGRTVAVVPGADVLTRRLGLPAGRAAQQKTAALWALKDELAQAEDRLAVALGAPDPEREGTRLVSVASRALIEAWRDYLQGLGVRADVMVPDYLALPEPEAEDTLTALRLGGDVALRGPDMAATVQADLVDLAANGRRLSWIEGADRHEAMLAAAAIRPPVNLLGAAVSTEKTASGSWRRALALAAMLAISPLVLTLVQAGRDEWAARAMMQKAQAEAKRLWPDMATGADVRAEMMRRLEASAPAGGGSAAAAVLFQAVEDVEGAELDSFSVDPETGVRATLTYPAYQDLDALKAAVAAAGMSLSDDSTVDDQGRVVSEVRIGAGA